MARGRRLSPPLFLLLAVAAGLGVSRRYLDVVEVRGHSMAPALKPGDRLLVESRSFERRQPRPGEIVLAADPRDDGRELIKRVTAVDATAGEAEVRGDSPDASTDSRTFGAVPLASIRWRAAFRYWPLGRAGRL